MQVELNGLPVFIDTGGRDFIPSLPTLVFLHGAQLDHFVWKPLVSRFAGDGLNVLAPDLPGHGASSGPRLPGIEALADWLVALLMKVSPGGTAPLVLVGHSMGSLIALEAATRLPDCTAHLVMIGTAIPMPVSPTLLEMARNNEAKAMALINRWSHSPAAWRGAQRDGGGHGLWLPGINLRLMERQARGVLLNDLAACNDYRHGKAAAEQIDCPVTIIAGSEDRMTSSKAAHRLVGQIPHARLVELDGVGHALMAEAPRAVGDAIARTIATN
mgnify:CR=1 FL=1